MTFTMTVQALTYTGMPRRHGGSVSPSSRTVAKDNTTTFTVTLYWLYTRISERDASGGSWSGTLYTRQWLKIALSRLAS